MTTGTQWRDIETAGYVVIPSFLSEPEIEIFRDDFRTGRDAAKYAYGFKPLGQRTLAATQEKVDVVLREVRAHTTLQVDVLAASQYFDTTKSSARTSYWHVDFDIDYRFTGDHANYLNFYMPITKPHRALSNVSLVPLDALRARSPAAHQRLARSGGHRLIPFEGKTAIHGDGLLVLPDDIGDRTPEAVLDFDVGDLAVTPELGEGDLLLVRGDVIHRTQDADTRRISASIRTTHSGKTIKRDRLLVFAARAAELDEASRRLVASVLRCSEVLGVEEITIEQFRRCARDAPGTATGGRQSFVL